MRVFLTGATGFIGSRIVPQLIGAGHQVLGLTRSDAGARSLEAQGAAAHRGDLEHPATLTAGAEQADAVIHCAFDHDFSNFLANCAKDKAAIEALGAALKGSDRPLLITSGTGIGGHGDGRPATEDVLDTSHPNPRIVSELTGNALLDAGVNVSVMRLPQVHDTVKQGLITPMIEAWRAAGAVAYVGDGANRWAAGHIDDVALLYRLAIEQAQPGWRHHAVGEEGITAKEIAETVAAGLGVPVRSIAPDEAPAYFGPFAMFASLDMPASSAITRERLGWTPVGPTLIEDLAAMDYATVPPSSGWAGKETADA
jgi:nucleoside-diphosphate-sugar epimerase